MTNKSILPDLCLDLMKHIYHDTTASVVAIGGLWKTGKTNFGLLLCEELRRLKWIVRFASNVETDASWIEKVQSLSGLQMWSSQNSFSKLFLYDELIESTPSRRAMSTLNVEWVKFLPQASKKHLHILVLMQTQDYRLENYADSVWFSRTYNRGTWMKRSLKQAEFSSENLKVASYILDGIPPTAIGYNPDLSATFAMSDDVLNFALLPDELKAGIIYGQGKNFQDIEKALNIQKGNRQIAKRLLSRYCRGTYQILLRTPEATRAELMAFFNKKVEEVTP